jgi:hypothetical protein
MKMPETPRFVKYAPILPAHWGLNRRGGESYYRWAVDFPAGSDTRIAMALEKLEAEDPDEYANLLDAALDAQKAA